MHASGKLAFRSNVRAPKTSDLPVFEPGETPLDWSTLTAGAGEIELEIGCGKGAFLIAAAGRHPHVRYIGVEAGRPYAEYCADRVKRGGLRNAVLVADDARVFLADTVPEGALGRIHVYYPDPWPKRRHRKRRIFDGEFPGLAARALRPGGELLVATDNTRYFGEILAVLGASPLLSRSRERERFYGDELPGVAFGPTNFAEKYRATGRARHRAVYAKDAVERPKGQEGREMSQTGTDTWVRVADVSAIPEDEGLPIECQGKELALFRNGDRIACLEDSCPHRGAALSEGKVRDGEVICPWHGWRFGLEDGECSTLPGSMPAATFDVRVDGNDVFIKV